MITFYPLDQQKLFTNRDYELAQLNHLVQTMQTGPAEHAALFGLRRIGKTLLLKEFMRRLLKSGSAVLPVYMDFSTLASSPENFSLGYVGLVCHWLLNRGEGSKSIGCFRVDGPLIKISKRLFSPFVKWIGAILLGSWVEEAVTGFSSF